MQEVIKNSRAWNEMRRFSFSGRDALMRKFLKSKEFFKLSQMQGLLTKILQAEKFKTNLSKAIYPRIKSGNIEVTLASILKFGLKNVCGTPEYLKIGTENLNNHFHDNKKTRLNLHNKRIEDYEKYTCPALTVLAQELDLNVNTLKSERYEPIFSKNLQLSSKLKQIFNTLSKSSLNVKKDALFVPNYTKVSMIKQPHQWMKSVFKPIDNGSISIKNNIFEGSFTKFSDIKKFKDVDTFVNHLLDNQYLLDEWFGHMVIDRAHIQALMFAEYPRYKFGESCSDYSFYDIILKICERIDTNRKNYINAYEQLYCRFNIVEKHIKKLQKKDYVLQDIRHYIKANPTQAELFQLYNAVVNAKKGKDNLFRTLWINILAGNKCMQMIRDAINSRIQQDGYIADCLTPSKLKEIFPKGINSIELFHYKGETTPIQGPMYLNVSSVYDPKTLYHDHYPIKNSMVIHVYRGDFRPPSVIIESDGFHPKELEHKGLKGHTSSNASYRSGGISTSMDFDQAKLFGNYVYRINLNSGQATDVNATMGKKSNFPREKEMLVTNGITPEQIEYYHAGNCYTLQDVKKKIKNLENVKLKASPFNDRNQHVLCNARKLIEEYYSGDSEKAEKVLKRKYRLQQALMEMASNEPSLINEENWYKIKDNNNLQNTIIAIKAFKSGIQLSNECWKKISKNSTLQAAILALHRTDSDLINIKNFTIIKEDIYLQEAIVGLWEVHPNLIKKNFSKIMQNTQLKKAIAGAYAYIHFSDSEYITIHNSIYFAKKFITDLIQNDGNVLKKAKDFINGEGEYYKSSASGNGEHSRRTILAKYLNYDFHKKGRFYTFAQTLFNFKKQKTGSQSLQEEESVLSKINFP